MIEKIAIGIISIILAIGVCGCMSNSKDSKKDVVKQESSVKDMMMEHMREKYNEEFEFVNIDTEVWTAPYTEMIVKSEKFPNHRIVVQRYSETGAIVDNYMDFHMKERIEEELTEIVKKIYPKSKVFYRPGGRPVPNSVTPDISIAEYSKIRLPGLPVTICIEDPDYETNKDKKIEELRKVLEGKKYICHLDVFYIKEDKLDLINEDNRREVLTGPHNTEWVLIRGGFLMTDSFEFDYYEWREIK
ncbi:hypothetical protein [Acetivibrio saccincola]|uniref:Uncharacterized protein n=1 Tax=Acetivibrio saccincola TaxID=1677857 RepID=A0A2S8R768_9FIRM|nr:hypothetical protein [Acetivibrio saccincola]PQQ65642.1 hypothetical protein B9R14_01895 [Acetivibrio saccincola]